LAELLHGLTQFPAHHALQFGDGAFHHAGEILQGTADGGLGFNSFELALELLNFAQALGDDFGVLFVKGFQTVELGFVFVDVGLDGGQFFGVMSAVGFVVGGGGGLEQALELFALAILSLHLVLK
jgi:hypothetical protein